MGEDETRWLTDEEQTAWRSFLRANREILLALDRDLQADGLSLSEYELLSMLSEAPGGALRMSALADLIVQSRSRVTHTSARLEKRGWVERAPAPDDGRGVILTLTHSGRALLQRVSGHHVDSVRKHVVDLLEPADFRRLGALMLKIRENYAANVDEPGKRSRS